MASEIVKQFTVQVPVKLIKIDHGEGYARYYASVHNVACGSGDTPQEAYKSLAYCLAIGDEDVDSQERIQPWVELIAKALESSPVSDPLAHPLPFA